MIHNRRFPSAILRFVFLLLVLLFVGARAEVKAQFIVDTYSNDTFTTFLHVDSSILILTFDTGYSFQQCSTAVAGTPSLQPLDSLLGGPIPNSFRASLISTPTVLQYNTAKSHLVSNVSICKSVQPVYKNYSGGLVPSDIIIVHLATLADSSFLKSDAVSNNCQVLGASGFDPFIWFIQQDKRTDPSPLTSSALNANTTNYSWVETNFVYPVSLTSNVPTDPLYATQWALKNTGANYPTGGIGGSGVAGEDVQAEGAWNFTKGCVQIKIGIMDEGMDCSHEDFSVYSIGFNALATSPVFNNVITSLGGCYNAIDNLGDHGTSCAGIIVGEWNDTGMAGLAPSVQLTSIYTVSSAASSIPTGTGTDDITLSSAYYWASNNGIDILSGSFAIFSPSPSSSQILNPMLVRSSMRNFVQNGRNGLGGVIFHSTGNGDFYQTTPLCSTTTNIGYPGSEDDVIAVTGTSPCAELKTCNDCTGTNYPASHGVGTDVAAPYWEVWAPVRMGTGPGFSNYDLFGGTSASTPLAAGTMALILSANPYLTHTQARFILESTCDKIGGYTYTSSVPGQPNGDWSFELGYGRVNAGAAVELAMETEVVFLELNGSTVPGNEFIEPSMTFSHTLTASVPSISITSVIHWFYNGKEVASGTSSYSATKFGVYKFVVKTDCGMTQSAELRIIPDCENISSNLTSLSGTLSSGTYSNSNGYYIPNNTTITISTSSVSFQNTFIAAGECTKIYVPAGGNVTLDNVQVIGCADWKGIEVDGNMNAAPGLANHGNVYIRDSYIENAEIGAYSKHGGTLTLSNNTFYRNSIHVALADYNQSYSLASLSSYNEFGPIKATGFTCGESRGINDQTTYTSSSGSITTVKPYFHISNVASAGIGNNTFYDHELELVGRYSIPNNSGLFSLEQPSSIKTGIFGYGSKDLTITDNTIYVHGDCGIHLKSVSGLGSGVNYITSNEIGRYSGITIPTGGSKNGLRMESCANFEVTYNQFLAGLNYGISVINSFSQLSFETNYFFTTKYGIVVAPVEWPFTTSVQNTLNSTSMNVMMKCNKFETVEIAIGISGNLVSQGSTVLNSQNKFYNIQTWEVVSRGWSPPTRYYYYSSFSNQVPRTSGTAVTLDNSVISVFSTWGTTSSNTGCYYSKNALFIEPEEEQMIKAYPNPFSGIFTLSALENTTFEIFDTKGQNVDARCQTSQISATEWLIDASGLQPGVYLICLVRDEFRQSLRIVHLKE